MLCQPPLTPPLKRLPQKKQPLLGAPGQTEYSPDTVQGTNHRGRGLPNSVSWVERGVASLQANYQSQSSGGRKAQCQGAEEHQQAKEPRKESASSPKPMEAVQKGALPPGFKEVMACLRRDPSPTTALEAPMEPLQLEMPIKPAIATMCASCIVQDEATGITYMDTITTSIGPVALEGSHLAIQAPGPTIEDITDLP